MLEKRWSQRAVAMTRKVVAGQTTSYNAERQTVAVNDNDGQI